MTLVLAPLDHPGFRVYGNALPVTPGMIPGFATLDGVTHPPQSAQGLSREALLDVHNVGEILLVKARSVHCALYVQASVGSTQKNIGDGRDDAWAAWRAAE